MLTLQYEKRKWIEKKIPYLKQLALSLYFVFIYIISILLFKNKYSKSSSTDIFRIYRENAKSDYNYFFYLKIFLYRKFTKSKIYRLSSSNYLSFFNFTHFYKSLKPQVYETNFKNKKLLVCFCDYGHDLNLTVPEFHSYARKHFQYILYLYDKDRNFYLDNFDNKVLNPLKKLLEILDVEFIASFGTSSGGPAALILAHYFNIDRSMACNPILIKENYPYKKSIKLRERKDKITTNKLFSSFLDNSSFTFLKNSRIFINSSCLTDLPSYLILEKKLSFKYFHDHVFNINFFDESHLGLVTLEKLGLLNEELRVLSGESKPSKKLIDNMKKIGFYET